MRGEALQNLERLVSKYHRPEDRETLPWRTAVIKAICNTFLDPEEEIVAYADREPEAEDKPSDVLICTDRRLCFIRFDASRHFSWYECRGPLALGYTGAVTGGHIASPSSIQVAWQPPIVRILLPPELAEVAGGPWWEWPVPDRAMSKDEDHVEPYRIWARALAELQGRKS